MPDDPRQPGSAADATPSRPVAFSERLLADSARAYEELMPDAIDDARANDAATAAGGDLEQRLVTRAGALPVASDLAAAIDHVRRGLVLVVVAAVALGLLAGAGTARAALGGDAATPVNFYLVVGSVLGVQSLLLLAWIVLVIARPRMLGSSSLGGLALACTRWTVARLHRGPAQLAAIQATGRAFAGGRLGRWTLSSISHAIWLAFNVGALVTVIWLLSARHYTFGWETTILSGETYIRLTRALAAGPELARFVTPTAEQIEASRWTGSGPLPEEPAQAWSSLLVGMVVLYGFGPRLLLLGLGLSARRAARRAFRLDLSHPGYAALRARLLPTTKSIGVIDGDDEEAEPPSEVTATRDVAARPTGAPAILAFELESPDAGWPPSVDGASWDDLGIIDGRDDQHRALDVLAAGSRRPSVVAAVCALTQTPDRGVEDFLRRVRVASGSPLALVLTGGDALRQRAAPAELDQRVDDWYALADRLGVDPQRTVEVDLDHLTPASRANLAAALGADTPTSPADRQIEAAFRLIVEHAAGWDDRPSMPQRGALHRAIAALYEHRGRSWRDLLKIPDALPDDVVGSLRAGAESMLVLLPARLKASRRWLAAGAAAGALGCIAAAALVTPAAIAAMPVWSGLGAAIGGLLRPDRASKDEDAGGTAPAGQGEAIRAAALFALLLELQGRPESAITRCLDQAIGDDEPEDDATAAAFSAWLDRVRHRLDLALASEASP
jgi:hypothetical protein